MATNLNLTTNLYIDHFQVTAEIVTTENFPRDIFMYENTGSGLGEYQGVCTLDEFKRLQVYTGSDIPVFGNRLLRFNVCNVHVPLDRDVGLVRQKIIDDVKLLKAAIQAESASTQSVPL